MTSRQTTTPKRAALYLRVSSGEQTTENQRRELEAVAKHSGWDIVAVYEDAGISGAKRRDQRPAYDQLLNDAARRQFDVAMAWSVDRLGRSLTDLVGFMDELNALGIDLYLHQQGIDTTTPSGRAMFQMCGVFAEFERAMISERVTAGLNRARAQGKRLGRRPIPAGKIAKVMDARAEGLSIRKIAVRVGVSPSAVHKVIQNAA
jgi:DNA invertase Pin-like site-specific DNA recombinase